MSVGHDPKSGPHRPDMRKDEENITLRDRQEATRRIEGSLAPETDGFDMK
jgi:phosphatidylserine decarboxylase